MEVLKNGTVGKEGPYFVYRVTKRKMTTPEAAQILARESKVAAKDVSFAGLKDKQGITVQYVSVRGGKQVSWSGPELKIALAGKAEQPVTNRSLEGNLFDIIVRDLERGDLDRFRRNLQAVKRFGLPNYFDDQRFGCLRHGQGFIVREMLLGKWETALKNFVAGHSPFDSPEELIWKKRIHKNWGDWEKCRELSKRPRDRELFKRLEREPGRLREAFQSVPASVRLIHLYAYQSYLWNKGVALYFRNQLRPAQILEISTDMGNLPCPGRISPEEERRWSDFRFPLLDDRIEIADASAKRAVDAILRREGIARKQLQIHNAPGFQFKAEWRNLMVRPDYLRAKAPRRDSGSGNHLLELRFQLPPGSYATLVVKRLFAGEGNSRRRSFPRKRGSKRPTRSMKK